MNQNPSPAASATSAATVSRRSFLGQCGGLLASVAVGAVLTRDLVAAPVTPALAGQPALSVATAVDEDIYFADPGWAG